ncbi:hypothetical protein [Candidatus Formimonas warabiya]|uniref:Uncharacterized protein n=1 Tax=Formimonas warabiya TaxID=1761012 RepID=A0A3G1KMJ7_FORW1|nr:hypothetical protein [Candidatus Formimonas warabiya]ATW23634.1 hypothetical protein DCMF_01400 [Candidatus Formimonas warabiya]
MDKRFSYGFRSGLFGGIAMNAFSLIDYYIFHGTKLRYLDWSAVMLYGVRPDSFFAAAFALIAQLVFTSFLGILYAYLVTQIADGHYLFKGWLFGIVTWFFINALDILMKLQPLEKIPTLTIFSSFIGASIYGLVLGYFFYFLNLKHQGKGK